MITEPYYYRSANDVCGPLADLITWVRKKGWKMELVGSKRTLVKVKDVTMIEAMIEFDVPNCTTMKQVWSKFNNGE